MPRFNASPSNTELRKTSDVGIVGFLIWLTAFSLCFDVATYSTWESTCAQDWLTGETPAADGSTLERFCSGKTLYSVNLHFGTWIFAPIGFGLCYIRQANGTALKRVITAWTIGAILASIYISPFLILSG